MLRKFFSNKKGQGLVEYALIIAGVALVAAAAISTFGHKTTDMIAAVAAVIPGAHEDANQPIVSGHLIETTGTTNGIALDTTTIAGNAGNPRLGNNLGLSAANADDFGGLVLD